ncbi:MAG: hypothetical protein ACN4GT_04115 [Gammaproteobacteria bacterium]
MLMIVAAVGVLVCLGCIVGIVSPNTLMGVVRSVMNKPIMIYLAVGVRLALGVLLILVASASLFPLVFRVIGAIAILAALGLLLMGRARIVKLVEFFAGMSAGAFRAWLIFGFVFGAFLVYGTGLA